MKLVNQFKNDEEIYPMKRRKDIWTSTIFPISETDSSLNYCNRLRI